MLADTIKLLELTVVRGTLRLDEDVMLTVVKVVDELESEMLVVGKGPTPGEGTDEELLLEMVDVVGT